MCVPLCMPSVWELHSGELRDCHPFQERKKETFKYETDNSKAWQQRSTRLVVVFEKVLQEIYWSKIYSKHIQGGFLVPCGVIFCHFLLFSKSIGCIRFYKHLALDLVNRDFTFISPTKDSDLPENSRQILLLSPETSRRTN